MISKFLPLGIFVSTVLGAVTGHAQDYSLLRLEGRPVRWQQAPENARAVLELSYAFLREPATVPGARNCKSMIAIDATTETLGVSFPRFQQEVDAAFHIWARVLDIRFRKSGDPARADILIGSQATPRGIAFADVRVDTSQPGEFATISGASICLNPNASWAMERDGSAETFTLRYVIAHEIGHTLGLDHPGRTGQLMAFAYQEDMTDLTEGDIAGIAGIYGTPSTRIAMQPSATDNRKADSQ